MHRMIIVFRKHGVTIRNILAMPFVFIIVFAVANVFAAMVHPILDTAPIEVQVSDE